jgi:hypothetical protein
MAAKTTKKNDTKAAKKVTQTKVTVAATVVAALDKGPLTFDEIVKTTKIGKAHMRTVLHSLGKAIERTPGTYRHVPFPTKKKWLNLKKIGA